jgi:hypothetical protein
MADLFHRLVSGPVAGTERIVPRLPSLVEPSIVDAPVPLELFEQRGAPSSPVPSHRVPDEPSPPRTAAPIPVGPAPRAPDRATFPAPAVPPQGAILSAMPVPPAAMIVRSERETVTTHLESRITPVPPVSHVDTAVREQVRPAVLPDPRRAGQQSRRQTVQITIGRIEIRAPQPQPVPPVPVSGPAPAPGPARAEGLSLTEYLRGDDGRPR